MFGFHSRSRVHGPQLPLDDAVDGTFASVGTLETPLVPCNNLRAHWVVAEDGKLELRWEPDAAVTELRPRRPIPPHGGVRRSA